jgi:D-alanyl-D-alanine carboxypeptidase/D-alanyl-D-alanine-endopeptidase (penicillin-binding protein 4)
MSSSGNKSFEARLSLGARSSVAKRVWRSAFLLCVLLVAPAIVAAQQGAAAPSPAPQLIQGGLPSALPIQTQRSSTSGGLENRPAQPSALAKPSYLTSVRGVQGVLAETDDGVPVAAQSVDEKFNPASSIKLATTLVALQTYGPGHRFMTALWTNGKIDSTTGSLYGDLMVSGSDPSLHYEHAVVLAQELNRLGIETVVGNLVVAPSFTMNFDWSARSSGQQFLDALDASRRSAMATRAWIDERMLVGDKKSLQTPPSVAVLGGVVVGSVPVGAQPLLIRKSSKLVDVLKVMLCYSNNFMAERIGDMLGGPESVRGVLAAQLKIDPEEVMISSTSGLGVNRVTPRAMMKILRALRDELARNKLSLSDILPVAGVDPGTLKDRYTSDALRGTVIAKTGTLIRTDGGASSLVGETQTKSGKVVLFVIMNQQGSVLRFRENQDEIVSQIQSAFGGPAPFSYRPVALPMRLSNSDYEAARSRGEYEPKN